MRKLIKVTQKHINKGKPSKSCLCPVALACQDTFGILNVNVILGIIDVGCNPLRSPRSVDRFIKKFDKHGKKAVKPFNFYLETD